MGKKVLIVDDEPATVQFLALRLTNSGYEVLKAYNGVEAVKIAKKEQLDLIILDILMPEMDGTKTAAILKESPETKNIPIIFLTCLFTKEDEKQGNKRGGEFFVAKPYDGDQLLKVIKENIK
ncbi:MAG: response regulator [Candidatus Omnitrophota bacterium]|nr:response regulator [Candidatus Omnitrophota bacterium]